MSILGLVPLTEVRLFETLNVTGRSELQSIVNDYNKRVKERVDKFNRDTNQSTASFFDIYNTYYKLFSHVDPPIMTCDGKIDCGK
jgi:hypothetical protein